MKQKHSEEGGDNDGPKFQNNRYKKITYFAFILVNSFPVTRRAFSFAKASCGLLDKKIVTSGLSLRVHCQV